MRVILRLLLRLLPVPALAAVSRAALALAALALAAVSLAAPALATAPTGLCAVAIAAAQRHAHLPHGLLAAMAKVESGRPDPSNGRLDPWPWTIDAEGAGQFFASRKQAIAAVRALQAQGVRSIDVGCLQVNLQFHPHAFASLDQAFDPRANAAYAARLLTSLHAAGHGWMQAVAAYHSATPVIGADYRDRVLALWRKPDLPGWGLGLATAYRLFLPRHAVYADFPAPSEVYGAFAPVPGARR